MSALNPRVEPSGPDGYPGATVLTCQYLGQEVVIDPACVKNAIVNAGYILGNPDMPSISVVARLRDGTKVPLNGPWIGDRELLHVARHYLWQKYLGQRHTIGPYEAPTWKPQPLPDAFGPDTDYAPVSQ